MNDEITLAFNLCLEKRTSIESNVPDLDPNPDPNPHVGPPGSGSFYHQAKIVRKTLIPTILRLPLDFLSLKNDVQ
jgi:hypothetical protein